MLKKTTKSDVRAFIKEYNSGSTISAIAHKYNFAYDTVERWLVKNGVKLKKGKFNKPKIGFSKKEKNEIIHLYSIEKRGADYIGKMFNRSDMNIAYWLNKWGVKKNSRSEISKTIRNVYGATKGFTGFKHKRRSKKKISESCKKIWENDLKTPASSNSKFYETKIGKVLGSYEVAYLQKLREEKKILPEVGKKNYKTPFGFYRPDFKYKKKFVEVKSEFTLKIAKGKIKDKDGKKSNQWKKIKWFHKNIKPVEVIVLTRKEVIPLFKRAVKEGFVKIKNKRYEK